MYTPDTAHIRMDIAGMVANPFPIPPYMMPSVCT